MSEINTKTMLFLDGDWITSLEQLKEVFAKCHEADSPLGSELIAAYHNGLLKAWLSSNGYAEIVEQTKEINVDCADTELLKTLQGVFCVKSDTRVKPLNYYVSLVDCKVITPSHSDTTNKEIRNWTGSDLMEVTGASSLAFYFKLKKTVNEEYNLSLEISERREPKNSQTKNRIISPITSAIMRGISESIILLGQTIHLPEKISLGGHKVNDEIEVVFNAPFAAMTKSKYLVSLKFEGETSGILFLGSAVFKADLIIRVADVNIEMISVDGGEFEMGETAGNSNAPLHKVKLRSFMIGRCLVTNGLWNAIMDEKREGKSELPVVNVSCDDCDAFIKRLNGKTGRAFRLPTEAEWEFAARGGIYNGETKYSGSDTIDDVAWYRDNSDGLTGFPVCKMKPNELGIYDMSGNVFEWCGDWYGEDYYLNSPADNPTGPSEGIYRVRRGGSWNSTERDCRVSTRSFRGPNNKSNGTGFRIVLPL